MRHAAIALEQFEADPSVAHTGPGARREGFGFERLAGAFWESVSEVGADAGASLAFARQPHGGPCWSKLSVGPRSLYLPCRQTRTDAESMDRWLELEFDTADMVAAFPGEATAVARWAPTIGQFAGERYPRLYAGLCTRFDDTLVLEDGGVLLEKILLEYKTAKSSGRDRIDGNAHERLSFQTMQYLEVATRFTQCSFVVMANSAFVRYRNKYHVSFHVQAERLSSFRWFTMRYICMASAYLALSAGLLTWLETGVHVYAGGLPA